jgi:hypothetical protein
MPLPPPLHWLEINLTHPSPLYENYLTLAIVGGPAGRIPVQLRLAQFISGNPRQQHRPR